MKKIKTALIINSFGLFYLYLDKKNEENILFHWVDSCCVFSTGEERFCESYRDKRSFYNKETACSTDFKRIPTECFRDNTGAEGECF